MMYCTNSVQYNITYLTFSLPLNLLCSCLVLGTYKQWSSSYHKLQVDYRFQDPDLPTIKLLEEFQHQVHNIYYYKQFSVCLDLVAADALIYLLKGFPDS